MSDYQINPDGVIGGLEKEGKKANKIDVSEFREINLNEILPNPENIYPISDNKIIELARSIRDVGLIDPVVVSVITKKDLDGVLKELSEEDKSKYKYLIASGETRYRAIKYNYETIKEKYEKSQDKDEKKELNKVLNKYSVVKCRVLSSENEKDKSRILRDANDYTRVLTPIQKIALFNPKKKDEYFSDVISRRNYIERAYGEDGYKDFLDGKIEVGFTDADVTKDIVLRLRTGGKKYTIADSTIEDYVGYCKKLNNDMLRAIIYGTHEFKGVDIKLVSKLKPEDMTIVANRILYDEMDFAEATKGMFTKDEMKKAGITRKPKKKKLDVVPDKKLIAKARKTLSKFYDDNYEIINNIDFSSKDCTLNGNQKENLKQIKTILKEIAELKELDK